MKGSAMQYPALYSAASDASKRYQSQFFWLVGLNLGLFILVSAITAPHSLKPQIWFFCGVVLLINFGITLALAIFRPEQSWFAARAMAESVKTTSWRFAMRAEPFGAADDAATPLFRARLKEVFSQNKKFSAKFSNALNGDQLPANLVALRGKSLQERIGLYRDARVVEQGNWYTTKSKSNRTAGFVTMFLAMLAMLVAVAIHFLRAVAPEWSYWPGDTAITVALSILSWLQAKKYVELAESYSMAAQDISFVLAGLGSVKNEGEFSTFIGDAENAFSREHTQWIARKDQ